MSEMKPLRGNSQLELGVDNRCIVPPDRPGPSSKEGKGKGRREGRKERESKAKQATGLYQ